MKVRLMNPRVDFSTSAITIAHADDLIRDLELDTLWEVMGGGDRFLLDVARSAMLQPLHDAASIRYRQQAYEDVRSNGRLIDELFRIASEALMVKQRHFLSSFQTSPRSELYYATEVLTELADYLERLQRWMESARGSLMSEAFVSLCDMIAAELTPDYLRVIRSVVKELRFPSGLLMESSVGLGGQVSNPVLRRPRQGNRGFFDRTPLKRPMFSFTLPERDESGARELSHVRDVALEDVAHAAVESCTHILAFFTGLKVETGFYVSVWNLEEALRNLGLPVGISEVKESMYSEGLYEPCLALRLGMAPVDNDVGLGERRLLIVTGANRGGKSTLLRALGVGQLMMQAGMFVPAKHFAAPLVGGIYTHWAREEDAELVRGKFDDELQRMDDIVNEIRPGDLLLSNESFSSTNEAEGSQILEELTEALVHSGIRVYAVSHLYGFSEAVGERLQLSPYFMRAPRADDGARSYRLEEGAPLDTSYGIDLYDAVFGTSLAEDGENLGRASCGMA